MGWNVACAVYICNMFWMSFLRFLYLVQTYELIFLIPNIIGMLNEIYITINILFYLEFPGLYSSPSCKSCDEVAA